jgi:hypothetical protein
LAKRKPTKADREARERALKNAERLRRLAEEGYARLDERQKERVAELRPPTAQ